jgi:hypothetical protein
MENPTEKILRIARSFPCLEKKLAGWNPPAFDPDKFFQMMGGASHGEWLCAMFILNVWDPGGAKLKEEWHFEFFDFAGIADSGNRRALVNWLANPEWP